MKNKIKNLLESGLTISTQHFYVDYHKEEGVFEIYGSRNLRVTQFWSAKAMREAAEDLIKIADEIDDLKKISENETYFFVHPTGRITSIGFTGLTTDIFNMVLGNIFKTEDEAEKHKDEILAKFEEARKKYVRD